MQSLCRVGIAAALALAGVLGGSSPAAAQVNNPYTWNTTDGLWSLPANWLDGLGSPAAPPSDVTTALVFGATGTTSYTATNDFASFTLNSITFNNTGSGLITIGGSAITLGGTTPTFTVSAGSAAVTANLTGASTLAKAGAGTLILSGANAYTGATTISGGTLVYAGTPVTTTTVAGFAFGTVTSGPVGTAAVILGPGGTFTIDAADRVMRNVLTFTGTAANPSVVGVPAGREFTLTGNTTGAAAAVVNKTGDGLWRIAAGSSFTGTLNINGGTVLLTDIRDAAPGTGTTGGDFNATSIVVNSGAKFQFATATPYPGENPDLPAATVVTINTGGVTEWHVGEDYGAIRLQGGAYNTRVNNNLGLTSILESGTIGPVNGVAGSFGGAGLFRKTTAGTVTITGVTLNNTGGLAVEDGVLATSGGITNTGNITLGTATTAGTLRYTGTVSGSIPRALVLTGQGGTLEVTDPAVAVTVTGAVSGAGPLTKAGPGTVALTGALNQTGTITVAAGTLAVNPVTSAGGFAVADGSTFAVNSAAGTTTLTVPTLTLGGAGATVRFDLNTAAAPTVPLVTVTAADGLIPGGGTLSVANPQQLPNGAFTLIDYAGSPITSGFALRLPGRTTGNLVYDTANTRIDVNVTGSDSVIWTGAVNATWDKGTAANVGGTFNLKLASNNSPTNFIDTDTVLFDDTTTIRTVSLAGALQPAAVTVNTGGTYTFQGSGSLAGAGSLTKQGSGTLVLLTDNTYSGTTTVTAGTLQVGNGGTTGSLGTGPVVLDGALVVDRSTDLAIGGNISSPSGAGTLTKRGAGTLTLLGNSLAFTGVTTIDGGTLHLNDLGGGGDLGSGSIVVNTGGTFRFGGNGNPDLPANTYITISGGTVEFNTGEDYGGFHLISGAYNSRVNNNLTADVTTILESGTLGPVNGVNGSLAGAGSILKQTAGTVTVTGLALNANGGLTIDEGTLSTDAAIGGTGFLTLGNQGTVTLQYRGPTAAVANAVSLAEGGAFIDVTQPATVYTFSGVVSGVGVLNKTGPGTLALTGANTYAGPTTVAAGTLLVNGNQSAATGPVAVPGGTLGGSGTVGGAVSVGAAGRIKPGTSPTARTLNVANTLAVNGGKFVVTLFGVGSETSGTVAATGAVTLSGSPTLELDLNGQTAAAIQAAGPATYTIITGGSVTGTFAQPNFTAQGFAASEWTVATVGNTVVLTFTPVPEPATVLGLAAAGLGLARLARRRRARAG